MVQCVRCGESLGFEGRDEDQTCTPCRAVPPDFEEARAFGIYTAEMRALIHLMKYENMPAMAEALAPMLAEAALDLRNAPAEMTVIAVPLFRRKRPFNQSERIADHAIRMLAKRKPEWTLHRAHLLLKRTRNTTSQFGLSPRQRRLNLRGAFEVRQPGQINGKHILLVDDIYTTGATARECSRVLMRAGAASVRVVTLARAQKLTATLWQPPQHLHPPSRSYLN
ncbi:MAG: ComF family protein [Acidobacteria bacterium]|nr:ComF family protein [Acidobacteriota bacterium]